MHLSDTPWVREQLWQRLHLPQAVREQGLIPLLLSTTLAEVAGNIVYVVLLERAYQLGDKVASVGGVMLAQAVPQLLLGIWAGSLVDRLGKRKAATLATLVNAALVAGLIVAQTILAVYILAFLIMLTRLALIPARLALISHISNKANLVATNTALALVIGLGIFLGPAISAGLMLGQDSFQLPLIVAGLGLLLSVPPLLFVPAPAINARSVAQASIWEGMRTGWQFIRQHNPIRRLLLCMVHIMLIMGAVMPLITPLAHEFGLGSAGSGVFFSAVGFGVLIGALIAAALARRLSPSITLLLAGLLMPIGALFIGLIDNLEGVLVAIILIHLAEAILNIIVITVLQRLTPLKIQGYLFGVVQTLLGIAWVVSLATVTGGLALWPKEANLQMLFLWIGGVGILAILTCWFFYQRQIQTACGMMCELRLKVLGPICQVICESRSRASAAACRLFCGGQLRCVY